MQIYLNLEGTVLDVSDRYYAVYRDLLEQAGYLPFDKNTYWSLVRVGVDESVIIERTCDSDYIEDYRYDRARLIEDPAYLMLDTLQPHTLERFRVWQHHHSLVLTTFRRNYTALIAQMDMLDLRDYLSDILVAGSGGDGWEIKKQRIQESQENSDNAFVIADNECDILAAHALEIPSIAICSGRRTRSTLKQLAPDLIVRKLDDLSLEDWPALFDQEALRQELFRMNSKMPTNQV